MRALVTGGHGFIGRAIVAQLEARGDEVSVFSRRTGGDVRDAEAVRRACEGMDRVFHVAAAVGVWGPWREYFETNVTGTRNVIDACRTAGVRRLVYTSTPSVVFDGTDQEGADETLPYAARFESPYPKSKALAERLVIAEETVETVSLRPHLVFGPGDPHLFPRVIAQAKVGKLVQVGPGTNRVDLTFVEDAARAHLLAADAESPGKVYFISQGEPANLWEWVARLLVRLGLPPVRRSMGYGVARAVGLALECVHRVVPGEPRLTRFVANELARSHWYDIGRARRELGYAPSLSLDEALAKTLAITNPR